MKSVVICAELTTAGKLPRNVFTSRITRFSGRIARQLVCASSLTRQAKRPTELHSTTCLPDQNQLDIASIIIRWRSQKYVYAADIAKMYRVDPRDLNYQRILWQTPTDPKVIEYQLQTVTYGMTCAPFLALRVLKQLAVDVGERFPSAVQILRDNIYVDDILFGADDESRARQLRDELSALLNCGGFQLRKWSSNTPTLFSDIDDADHGLACNRSLEIDERIKVLGITWSPAYDAFEFRVSIENRYPTSKRTVLSTIAKLYDPLWVTLVIIAAKIFMQQL